MIEDWSCKHSTGEAVSQLVLFELIHSMIETEAASSLLEKLYHNLSYLSSHTLWLEADVLDVNTLHRIKAFQMGEKLWFSFLSKTCLE